MARPGSGLLAVWRLLARMPDRFNGSQGAAGDCIIRAECVANAAARGRLVHRTCADRPIVLIARTGIPTDT